MLVLYVCFVDRCLSFCTFPFGHCVVCSSSIYGFWLPLWYLQTLLANCCCLLGAAARVCWSTLHFSLILDKVRIARDSRISIQQVSHERCTPSSESWRHRSTHMGQYSDMSFPQMDGNTFLSLLYGVTNVVSPKEFKLFSFPTFFLVKVTSETPRAY